MFLDKIQRVPPLATYITAPGPLHNCPCPPASNNLLGRTSCLFSCRHATLWEALSVRWPVHRFVHWSVETSRKVGKRAFCVCLCAGWGSWGVDGVGRPYPPIRNASLVFFLSCCFFVSHCFFPWFDGINSFSPSLNATVENCLLFGLLLCSTPTKEL